MGDKSTNTFDTAKVLANWADLNANLGGCDESQCWALLAAEKQGKARIQFLLRIYGRANKLRTQRERQELINK